MNRFTEYNPVTYQDVPQFTPDFDLMGQKVQEQQTAIDQTRLLMDTPIQTIGQEDEELAGRVMDYRQDAMAEIAKLYQTQGVNTGNKALKSLAREVGRDYKDPNNLVYKMQANYQKGMDTLKSIQDWDAPEWMKNWEAHRVQSQWKGTLGEGSTAENPVFNSYQGATLPEYIDINKELLAYGREIKPGIFEYFSGDNTNKMYSNDKGYYYLDKEKEVYLTENDLQRRFSNVIQSNPKMKEWVTKQSELALYSEGVTAETWETHKDNYLDTVIKQADALIEADPADLKKKYEAEGRDLTTYTVKELRDGDLERLAQDLDETSSVGSYDEYVNMAAKDMIDIHAATMAGVHNRYEHYIYLSKIDKTLDEVNNPNEHGGIGNVLEDIISVFPVNESLQESTIAETFPGLEIDSDDMITIHKTPYKLGGKKLTIDVLNKDLGALEKETQNFISDFPQAMFGKVDKAATDLGLDPTKVKQSLAEFSKELGPGGLDNLFKLKKEDFDKDRVIDKISFDPIEDPAMLEKLENIDKDAMKTFASMTTAGQAEADRLQQQIYKHNMLTYLRNEYTTQEGRLWEEYKIKNRYNSTARAENQIYRENQGALNKVAKEVGYGTYLVDIDNAKNPNIVSRFLQDPKYKDLSNEDLQSVLIEEANQELKDRLKKAGKLHLLDDLGINKQIKDRSVEIEKKDRKTEASKVLKKYLKGYTDNVTSNVQLINLKAHSIRSGDSKERNQVVDLAKQVRARFRKIDGAKVRAFFNGEQVTNIQDIKEDITTSIEDLHVGLMRNADGILKWHYVFDLGEGTGENRKEVEIKTAGQNVGNSMMIEIDPDDGDFAILNKYFKLNLHDRLADIQGLDEQMNEKGYFEKDLDAGGTPMKLTAVLKRDLKDDWYSNSKKEEDVILDYEVMLDGIKIPGVKSNFELVRLLEQFEQVKAAAAGFALDGKTDAQISEILQGGLSGGVWGLNNTQISMIQNNIMKHRSEGTILGDYTSRGSNQIYNAFEDMDFNTFKEAIPQVEDPAGVKYNPKSTATGKYQIMWSVWDTTVETITGITDPVEFANNENAQDVVMQQIYNQQYLPQAEKLLTAFQMQENRQPEQLIPLIHYLGYPNTFKFINTLKEDGLAAAETEFKLNNPNNKEVLQYMKDLIKAITQ